MAIMVPLCRYCQEKRNNDCKQPRNNDTEGPQILVDARAIRPLAALHW